MLLMLKCKHMSYIISLKIKHTKGNFVANFCHTERKKSRLMWFFPGNTSLEDDILSHFGISMISGCHKIWFSNAWERDIWQDEKWDQDTISFLFFLSFPLLLDHWMQQSISNTWFKHILFMTEHEKKRLGRAKMLWNTYDVYSVNNVLSFRRPSKLKATFQIWLTDIFTTQNFADGYRNLKNNISKIEKHICEQIFSLLSTCTEICKAFDLDISTITTFFVSQIYFSLSYTFKVIRFCWCTANFLLWLETSTLQK